jgi:glucose/arabinose dehydrogenase
MELQHVSRAQLRWASITFSLVSALWLSGLCLVALQSTAKASPAAHAKASPSDIVWPQITLTRVISNVSDPVYVTHAGDGSGRLFIVERAGRIRIFQNNTLLSTPFLSIADRVESGYVEQGLLSVAFPPGYGSKQYFYVYYTAKGSGDLVLARYRLINADVADPNSEQIVLSIAHSTNPNHNGGQLQFGPLDGYLYMGTGDGGGGGDLPNNAQNPMQLLGKLLRLDVETGNPVTYTIPASNPYTQTSGYRPEIWALGLRNPWRFSFDRQTGDLYIGDVGQDRIEEVDYQLAASAGGQNYGWRCYEGSQSYNLSGCGPIANYTFPITDYDSSNPQECAVTGGYVYRGTRFMTPRGIYFYGDYCSGKIWGLRYDNGAWQNMLLLDSPYNISSFGEDEAGNLYVAHLGGAIYRINSLEPSLYLPIVNR